MAQGKKVFKNTTNQPLQITLFIREGDNPGNEAGTQIFQLAAGQSATHTYGTDTNSIYLDGIVAEVVTRGSALDNLLNTNNTITFSGSGSGFTMTGSNT